jgi:hypothetical protein
MLGPEIELSRGNLSQRVGLIKIAADDLPNALRSQFPQGVGRAYQDVVIRLRMMTDLHAETRELGERASDAAGDMKWSRVVQHVIPRAGLVVVGRGSTDDLHRELYVVGSAEEVARLRAGE